MPLSLFVSCEAEYHGSEPHPHKVDTQHLTERQQCVNTRGLWSPVISPHTGILQGCVLPPLLFPLYTNGRVSHQDERSLIKFADDVALIGCLNNHGAEQVSRRLNFKHEEEFRSDY